MTVYRYLCKMRPPAPGSVPKRNLHGGVSGRINGVNRQYYGLVDYTEPLTDEEIEEYELDYVGTVEEE